MNTKIFILLYSMALFALGVITTLVFTAWSNNSSEVVQLPDAKHTSRSIQDYVPSMHQPSNTGTQTNAVTPTSQPSSAVQNTFNIRQFPEQQAQQLLNHLPDGQVNDYVSKLLSPQDAQLISNKRQFAQRALHELYTPNDNQPLIGQVVLSDRATQPTVSLSAETLTKKQKLYAHLNTLNKISLGQNVFVKWTNRSTGEVLLFEKKLIMPDSNTHWVSYQPYNDWQTGTYDIRFYQFNSQLVPVAQLTYTVYQVVD